MGNTGWNAEKIPDYLLKWVNSRVHDPEEYRLNYLAFATNALFGEPDTDIMKKLYEKDKEKEKRENHIKGNPLNYATIVRSKDGLDLYLDRKSFLRVMRKFPLNLWINGKPPHESPIAARSFAQEITVCPFEQSGEITYFNPNFSDIISEGMDRYNEKMCGSAHLNGTPVLKYWFYPTKYGVKKYRHNDLNLETGERIISEKDDGLRINLILRHFPLLLTEEF